LKEALKRDIPFLFLVPFIRDCEIISGMSPDASKQYGDREYRDFDNNSKVMIMTYMSFGLNYYSSRVRGWVEEVMNRGIVVVDEMDMLMGGFKGCKETYDILYRREKSWNVIGLSATPEKI
jgi:hypothetical protein